MDYNEYFVYFRSLHQCWAYFYLYEPSFLFLEQIGMVPIPYISFKFRLSKKSFLLSTLKIRSSYDSILDNPLEPMVNYGLTSNLPLIQGFFKNFSFSKISLLVPRINRTRNPLLGWVLKYCVFLFILVPKSILKLKSNSNSICIN